MALRCILTCAALSLGFAAGVTGPALASDPGVAESEVTVGMWSPLTGPTALLGTSERDAIEIAFGEINAAGGVNGRKLKLIAYDDAGSPQEALAAVRRLTDQDNVFALIAGSISGSTLPVLPLVNRAKVPFIASISSNNKLLQPFSRYIFRVYANETAQGENIVNYATKAGIKKPAIIYTSNDYGIGGEEVVARRLAKDSVSLVARERYNQGDQDFSAQLLRVKQAGADGLFVWAFAAEAGIIARQARELGLDIPLVGGGATGTPLFPKAAGPAGAGFVAPYVVSHLPDSATEAPIAAYRDALTRRYNGTLPPGRPCEYDLAGYAAAKIFAEALKRAGTEPTREGLIKALETLQNFDTTVTFPVTFTETQHEGTDKTATIRVNKDLRWEIMAER